LFCSISAFAANSDGASDLGVDYAFLTLMTLSPDFAAANYTITNNNDGDVGIAIRRLPYHIDLVQNDKHRLQLEVALAYQQTSRCCRTFLFRINQLVFGGSPMV